MQTLDELASNVEIQAEYKQALLLSLFKKLCVKMQKNSDFNSKIRNIFKQSHDQKMTMKLIVEKEFNCRIDDDDAVIITEWFWAFLKKKTSRKAISLDVKKDLYNRQNGKCVSCGEDLGDDWSKIHVDHIIPWVLVGDELSNNYQDLCETCNECKSSRIDYMLSRKLKLL